MSTSQTALKNSRVKEFDGEGQWVTIHGNPVFIESGQSVSEAFKAHAEKVSKEKEQVLPHVIAKAEAAIKAGKTGKSTDPTYHAYGIYWEAKVAYESAKGTPNEKAAYEKMVLAKGIHKSIASDVKSGKVKVSTAAPTAPVAKVPPAGTAGGVQPSTYIPNPTPHPTKPVTTAPLPAPAPPSPPAPKLPTPSADMDVDQLKSIFNKAKKDDFDTLKAASRLIMEKTPDGSMTISELEKYGVSQYRAIRDFTFNGYVGMNFNPDSDDSRMFLQGMRKLKPYEGKDTLYRGMKFDNKVKLEEFVDSIEQAPSYTVRRTGQSFSTSDAVAGKFSSGNPYRATLILEEHSSGRDLQPISTHKEHEITFIRGTKFKATKVTMEGNHAKIYIKEVPA